MAAMKLYAIYRIPPEHRSAGQYSVILTDQRPQTAGQAWEAIISQRAIIALIFSCTTTPDQLVELRRYTDAVVPPQAP